MARILLENVEKTYPNGYVAIRDLHLEVGDGEFLVLVGPSGCGKSTTLRLVAGLETPSRGRLLIGEREVTELPPQERDLAMVFQSYALYPHKSVRDNLAFGLRMRRVAKDEIGRRVEDAAAILGLDEVLDRKPRQLSGGQRQRVALGRAIVREPRAFLFDEPLSNLDAKLRVETRAELARLHRRLEATILYVTHDQEEAMTLGDRVAVMREGVLEQVAPPMEVYRRPASAFVAGFIGSPAMNFLRCNAASSDGKLRLVSPSLELSLEGWGEVPGELLLGVRPEDVSLSETGSGDARGQVDVVEPLGSRLLVHLRLLGDEEGSPVRGLLSPDVEVEEGERVGLRFRRDRLHLFEPESGARL